MNKETGAVRKHLKNLFELNDSHSTISTRTISTVEPNAKMHHVSEQELKEFNREELFAIADLLGMSDLYLTR